MRETYLISDTHFFHKNIINYANRPFNSIEEMNETLIRNWNKVIKKEYDIFVLGDVSLGGKNQTAEIISQLNGNKFLIMGNHDNHKSVKYWKEMGFDTVSKYPIIFNGFYIFSHEPIFLNDSMPYVNIHGHLHQNKYEGNQYYNVSVECIDYTPINFKKIEKFYLRDKEKTNE